jgi:cysteine desulfurase
MDTEAGRLRAMAERIRAELPARVADVVLHGHPVTRLPGLVAFSFLYVEGEALLLQLDARGIAVHSGSSCTSSTEEPSHVLAAMGALTHGSVRISLGRSTTEEDVDYLLDELPAVVEKVRAMSGAPGR